MIGTHSAMQHPLMPGTIKRLAAGERPEAAWLQVLQIRPYEKEGSSGRFRAAMSDSNKYITCMIVSPLAQAFTQKTIETGDIIKITSYQLNTARGQSFLVVGNAALNEIIKGMPRIGEPTNLAEPAAGAADSLPQASSPSLPLGLAVSVNSLAAPNHPAAPVVDNNPFQSNISRMQGPPLAVAPAASTGAVSGGGLGEGPAGSRGEPEALQTISNLSPYHNRWAIKARIVNKSAVKKFANAKGEGKLFSATCIDATGEIRMTAFGECVDKFFDMVQEGQVYYISNAQVKIAKRQFGVNNEYEIHLETASQIALAREGADQVPSVRYAFVPISAIVNLEKDSNCDVVGVIAETGDLGSIVTKTTGKTLSKRDLTMVDASGCSIRVTLWGAQAENYQEPAESHPIMAIKGARVGDYNGRTLSTSTVSLISLNPDIREAHELRGWYDSQGAHASSRSLSAGLAAGGAAAARDDRKTIAQIKEEHLGMGEKPDYFSVLASVAYIKSEGSVSYMACPTEGCNKKVIEEGPNMWRCEKCQKVFDRCDHRYILSLQIGDATGQTWVNAFNDTGAILLGRTAEEMFYLRANNEAEYQAVIKEALFKQYVFRIRAKQENYQGEQKLRCNIMAALPASYEEESKAIIGKLEQVLGQ